MTKLQLKSKFYRYTGIFLAKKEEALYLASAECREYVQRMVSHPENDMDEEEAIGLATGMWQCEHGFARPMVTWHWKYFSVRFKYPKLYPLVAFLASAHAGLRALKWDIEFALKRVVSKRSKDL